MQAMSHCHWWSLSTFIVSLVAHLLFIWDNQLQGWCQIVAARGGGQPHEESCCESPQTMKHSQHSSNQTHALMASFASWIYLFLNLDIIFILPACKWEFGGLLCLICFYLGSSLLPRKEFWLVQYIMILERTEIFTTLFLPIQKQSRYLNLFLNFLIFLGKALQFLSRKFLTSYYRYST